MTIVELMSEINVQQPTDDITGAWPLLWRFDIRPRAEWYYLQSPSAPASYRQPVAVTPPSDAPKPPVVVEREECVIAVVTENAVSVTMDSPAPVLGSAPHAVSESVAPVTTPDEPYEVVLDRNPFTGHYPEQLKMTECGTLVKEGYGHPRSCHLCGLFGSVEDMFLHRRSEGHIFEENRQKEWGHDCVSCNVMLLGYVNFVRHVCTVEHMERVVASGGRGWVLEKTEEYFDINLT